MSDVKDITGRDIDFAKWYTDVVTKAQLVDYSSVKGSMIICPYGYAIWENMQKVLDKMFKETGHENVQMPMFIPESLFNIEKEHVEGFAPEVAWVTYGGKEKLDERICVRPTSEVLFCDYYKKIIKSYRDLPKLYNQWCTIVRWEKTTRPFLRSREILWQEGHTMHATAMEAQEETLRMLHIYEDFQRKYLGIPVIVGKKTEKEKFSGAIATYSLEAMMYDGVALQNGTSHYFGDGFAKAFGITYLDKNNKLVTPFQTSWGVTTRMIGSLIMVHGDDRGLVLPPNIAPIKAVIIPIGDSEDVKKATVDIVEQLKLKNISYKVDDSNKTPGFKFAEAEVKGYPVRIEIGPRDLENSEITVVRRDTLEKIKYNINNVVEELENLFMNIQNNMYDKALKRRDSMIYEAETYQEFTEIANSKPGFIKTNWCGDEVCENKIKDDFSMKSRCLIEDEKVGDKCVCCGKKANYRLYFGRQY
ncbi:MAG: proline--tRNA ligase [Bacilli bacterium]|jgi:prolyl-tRNA synthetase|nr:proline--tRNA ligase [Bacilli bacterium]MCX4253968.1 proline--tRNA ligase [Bacilli bacterium]